MTTEEEILAVIVDAAKEAGAIIRDSSSFVICSTKNSVHDVLTNVDTQSQEIIEGRIKAAFPASVFLGEESVAPGSEASANAIKAVAHEDLLFIADPLDGTVNFVQSIPASVVSIGVARKSEMIVACIYDPYRDELFTAIKGKGAYLNGKRISVNKEITFQDSVWAFGLGSRRNVRKTMYRGVDMVSDHVRAVRSFGSAALHLAYVACGRITGFWELDLNAWDVCAGGLLVQEAGGRIGDTRGNEYTLYTRDMFAAGGADEVFVRGQELIQAANAASVDDKSLWPDLFQRT